MRTYVILDANSHVTRVQQARQSAAPAGALEVVFVGSGAVFAPGPSEVGLRGRHTLRAIGEMMRIGGFLEPRPVTMTPSVAGNVVTINPVPLGTVVEVFDLSGGERMTLLTAPSENWTETITLPDAGIYQIEVAAPGDALPVTSVVTV